MPLWQRPSVKIYGRVDNARKIHGALIDLDAIHTRIREEITEITDYYIQTTLDAGEREIVTVHVESELTLEALQSRLQPIFPITIEVRKESELLLPTSKTGKPQRFVDSR
jgi:hypothetical protein